MSRRSLRGEGRVAALASEATGIPFAEGNAAGFEVIRERRKASGYCDSHADSVPKTAAIAEVEVESVAYIVCNALGLDTGGYSFPT